MWVGSDTQLQGLIDHACGQFVNLTHNTMFGGFRRPAKMGSDERRLPELNHPASIAPLTVTGSIE